MGTENNIQNHDGSVDFHQQNVNIKNSAKYPEEVGQLFESHVDAVGLSINQPSRTASSSLARPHGSHGSHGGYGEAEAAHGAK